MPGRPGSGPLDSSVAAGSFDFPRQHQQKAKVKHHEKEYSIGMRPTTLFSFSRIRTGVSQSVPRLPQRAVVRFSSSEADPRLFGSTLHQALFTELTSRPRRRTYEKITTNPWELLDVSLADFLPPSCRAPNVNRQDLEELKSWDAIQGLRPEKPRRSLPQGYHLIHFPPSVPDSDLLPDGTDSLQSPGGPFLKRLWAGGSIQFNNIERFQMTTNKTAVCQETIADVKVKGREGQEKVFVTVDRRMAPFRIVQRHENIQKDETKEGLALEHSISDMYPWDIVEKRNLVFMREKTPEEAREDLMKPTRIIKPIHTPHFSVSLTPNAALLFRFSALTFNAHRIHIDPQYTREVEGHRNLLVHGPLTLTLMLSVLRSQLPEGKMIREFNYKNLAPLYADEELRICVGRDAQKEEQVDVWIEGKEGGYAVKGTAVIGNIERLPNTKRPKEATKPDGEDTAEGELKLKWQPVPCECSSSDMLDVKSVVPAKETPKLTRRPVFLD
ncbi:hypothetical protein VTL71DRAFT_16243 [Oculimacula yallundae]|uniref:Uncharacterized protein n=1 Tax=Oculimacula yallundae TaxID=86028 RepID=A0ABR4CDY0_9HELO